jgi:Tfp pilus assembly protein PilF
MHRFSPGHLLRNRDALFGLLLLLATLAAYYPAWNGRPIWDDDGHITAPELRSIAGLGHIWTKLGATQQYYPLVHTAFWVEHRLWGDAPFGYHLLNIMLHALSALLLYKILRRLAIPGAWFAAALFALHPIEVESVAWISELKNCLSGVFFFAAVYSYLRFDDTRAKNLYFGALCLFVLGLMAKTAIAPMPAALLVILWWKRGRSGRLSWKKDLAPLLPFIIAGISFGLFTSWVERTFIIAKEDINFHYSLIGRCLIAGRAFWFYPGKLLFPHNLAFSYARWNVQPAAPWQYLFPVCAAALAYALWYYRSVSKAPAAAAGYYFTMLFPALGFFVLYPFRYSFVADHFQYLAGVGPIVLTAALSTRALSRITGRMAIARSIVPLATLLVLSGLTFRQSGMYANAETLYTTTIRRNPSCWMAWNSLGTGYMNAGRMADAVGCFQRSLEINPDDYAACNNLGATLTSVGRPGEAIAPLRDAVARQPGNYAAWCNLGNAFRKCHRLDEAAASYRTAVDLDSSDITVLNNLCDILMAIRRPDEGIHAAEKAMAVAIATGQESLAREIAGNIDEMRQAARSLQGTGADETNHR